MKTLMQKILYGVISGVMFIIIPFIALIALIARLFKIDIYAFDPMKQRKPIATYVVSRWMGNSGKAQHNRTFSLFLMPSLSAFSLFVMFTFFHGIFLSMTNWDGLNTGKEIFVGLSNYMSMFRDYGFVYSLYKTIIYSVLNIFAINIVAFFLAILVTQNLKLKNLYRAGFFLPNLIGGLVLGYIWQFIFNRAITSLGGSFATSLLVNGDSALLGLIIVITWQYAGYIMMIYIAALQNVPQDLVEASKIDGANAYQRLRTVILPLVAQAFTVSMFLTLVTSFKQYDTVISLTNGGPGTLLPQWITSWFGLAARPAVGSNNLIALNIYQEAFARYQLGVGQAKAIVFFVFLLAVSLLQVYYNKRKEVEL
ncbi:MAG: multiple sugar transport system permease protein [Erysipelotrichaceae bacterium]|nr:MAG: multiple sugar transport system permease [Erysipelotrichaceae bacterium]TXT19334.1 MAG: multiple sugar transport system permease protein [Erysipelotrichaceae bacterium]